MEASDREAIGQSRQTLWGINCFEAALKRLVSQDCLISPLPKRQGLK